MSAAVQQATDADQESYEYPFHKTRGMTPNDPKLSDCGARRAGCGDMAGAGWAKAAGWWAAASVTRGAVRCSAWLGVAGLGRSRRATTGQKRRLGEAGETTEAGKLGLADTVGRSPRQTAGLGEDVKPTLTKSCVSEQGFMLGTLPDAAPASKAPETQAARVTGAAPAGFGGGKQAP